MKQEERMETLVKYKCQIEDDLGIYVIMMEILQTLGERVADLIFHH